MPQEDKTTPARDRLPEELMGLLEAGPMESCAGGQRWRGFYCFASHLARTHLVNGGWPRINAANQLRVAYAFGF